MRYAILECVNGSFSVKAEYTDLNGARVFFHDRCRILWNALDVITAEIKIVDEQLDCVEGYAEFIHHEVVETVDEGGESSQPE